MDMDMDMVGCLRRAVVPERDFSIWGEGLRHVEDGAEEDWMETEVTRLFVIYHASIRLCVSCKAVRVFLLPLPFFLSDPAPSNSPTPVFRFPGFERTTWFSSSWPGFSLNFVSQNDWRLTITLDASFIIPPGVLHCQICSTAARASLIPRFDTLHTIASNKISNTCLKKTEDGG